MHTSILCAALAGLVPHAELAPSPNWTSDYVQGQRQALIRNKPLAVFLAPRKGGWDKLTKEGNLGKEARHLLADRYVCVHVDTDTERGRQLALDFEVSGGLGLVISDRTGQLQAFRHEGTLPGDDLKSYLERYSAAGRVTQTTETHESNRTSYAAPSGAAPSTSGRVYPGAVQGWSQPSYGYAPSFSRGGC
ncbi:MAG: hypothetical protein HYS12_23050 [Planctomycetes bacterium]|nr:hypothetical protein [Planctomycetota bacterium]